MVPVIQPEAATRLPKLELSLISTEYSAVPPVTVEAFHARAMPQEPVEQLLSDSAMTTGVEGTVGIGAATETTKLSTVE